MKIINDKNLLTVPLFHGTSTLFIDSILKKGLGSINPLKELNLFDFGNELLLLIEKYLSETEFYKLNIDSYNKIIEQSIDGKLNFQHGNTYLAAVEKTAVSYALTNQYGSEFLSFTMKFLDELLNKEILIQNLREKYFKVFELINMKPTPILIKVENISKNSLLNEYGDSAENNLIKMDSLIGEKWRYDIRLDQCNFRLNSPISINNLTVYNITNGLVEPFNSYYNLVKIS